MQVSTSLVSEPERPAPGELAGRHARHDAFPLCGLAGARGASGLRAQPTAPRTMAVARMAQAREGADEILAVQPAGVDQPAETGGHGEAALAHRARLRGTEAGAWTGALRRTQLARLSPPCQLLHRCLRLPGGGAMPFFPRARLPTAACRQPPTSPSPPATRGETAWRCRLDRNGILRIPSPPCAARSQPTWRASCPDVPAACASSYNTVVLGAVTWLVLIWRRFNSRVWWARAIRLVQTADVTFAFYRIVMSSYNEAEIRKLSQDVSAAPQLDTLGTFVHSWLDRQQPKTSPRPVILVAAEGGGV